MFTIWVGENPSSETLSYYFATCPKTFVFLHKTIQIENENRVL